MGWGLLCGSGEGVKFGEHGWGLGRTDPLEYLVCLPQQRFGLRGSADGNGAAAQAGQCVGLVPGTGHGAGQFQCLLVAVLGPGEFTTSPMQRPSFIECLGLAAPVAWRVRAFDTGKPPRGDRPSGGFLAAGSG